MAKKIYDDDDGRTIADMSDIGRQPLIIPKFSQFKKQKPEEQSEDAPEVNITKQERRSMIAGALGAGFLIFGIFAGVGALIIYLLTLMR